MIPAAVHPGRQLVLSSPADREAEWGDRCLSLVQLERYDEAIADCSRAIQLDPDQCWNFQQVMRSHLHQMQELIRFRQGQVPQRLQQLLGWLALKFGRPVEQGHLIQLRLTHQDMADAIGTSRVTVTRLMQELERNGKIGYSEKNCVILPE